MRILTAALAATLLVAPALGQAAGAPASDAVKLVLEKGLILDIMGMPVDMVFNKDGSFAAMQGSFPGKYRVDGKKVCISSDAMPEEACMDIPDGKKSGESFSMMFGQLGETQVKIQ